MGLMKNYKYFLKESHTKTVVFAFGRFQPPTTGHALLVSAVEKTAEKNARTKNTDFVIYVSKTQDKKKNPLTVTQKMHYLKLMFPNASFKAASDTERTFLEVAKALNKKYKNLIMVAGSDRVAAFDKLLNQYNGTDYHYDSIQVISAGERDPDADDASGMSGTKMRALALDGNYSEFKKGLPHTLKDADGKQLMNDIRIGMGKESISEGYSIRESYYRGEIFNVGDIVETEENRYTILSRGTNYLFLEDKSGTKIKKWLHDVTPLPLEETMAHEDESKKVKYTSTDRLKVARIIAGALGIDATKSSSPEELINMALRKIRNKPMHSEYIDTIRNMLTTADQAAIKYDKRLIAAKIEETVKGKEHVDVIAKLVNSFKRSGDQEDSDESDKDDPSVNTNDFDTTKHNKHGAQTRVGHSLESDPNKAYLRRQKIIYWKEEVVEDEDDEDDLPEDEESLDSMLTHINDLEDIVDEYDDDELHIVDDEGKHVAHLKDIPVMKEEYITEVLKRAERIARAVRFSRSASKRAKKLKIALHRKSSSDVIARRARMAARKALMMKLARKPLDKLSIAEKESIEQKMKKRKKLLDRLAIKLIGKIRKIESKRLHPIK